MGMLGVTGITTALALLAVTSVAAGKDAMTKTPETASGKQEVATFAGGCFWCMEAPFDKLPGVISVTVGYTGGHVKNPTYEQVSAGGTGHAESAQIVYDPGKISYDKLLDRNNFV